ncbi:MAG: hypothetical protein ACI8SR_003113 [Oceanicoccus sp.]|jgi:hypothetical protein
MKLLLFTYCCLLSGVLFADGYVTSDVAMIEPLDASFSCVALSNAEDKSDLYDLDILALYNDNHSLASSDTLSHSNMYLLVSSQLDYFYHTRAPPFII